MACCAVTLCVCLVCVAVSAAEDEGDGGGAAPALGTCREIRQLAAFVEAQNKRRRKNGGKMREQLKSRQKLRKNAKKVRSRAKQRVSKAEWLTKLDIVVRNIARRCPD
ncbi:unnamed protein product [Lampetra fluviatilis]